MGVQVDAYKAFKNALTTSSLRGIVKTWKFNRKQIQLQNVTLPMIMCFPATLSEEFITMPKGKLGYLTLTISGKITNGNPDTLEEELLAFDEKIKNVIETDLQLDGEVTIENIGTSNYYLLDDMVADTIFNVIITTKKFTAGLR